jgi:hypothetical protein
MSFSAHPDYSEVVKNLLTLNKSFLQEKIPHCLSAFGASVVLNLTTLMDDSMLKFNLRIFPLYLNSHTK